MAAIGETIISALIATTIKKLCSADLLNIARREDLHRDLKKWQETLPKLQAVLDDADDKQFTNRLINLWLRDLQDLLYDVEDILDEFATEALRQQLKNQEASSSSKLSGKRVINYFIPWSPKVFAFDAKLGKRVKCVSARFDEIVAKRKDLELRENGGVSNLKLFRRLPSTCLVNESDVYGRESDKDQILKLVLRSECRDGNGFCVIPIVGMGGVGKTTLAQLVYNDERVSGEFDFKVWCCVSEDFDVVRVTKTVLEVVCCSESYGVKDLNLLQVKLRDRLARKRVLIVLDDIWNENYEDWTLLSRPFWVAAPGSKIIVTTRNQGVAAIMGTIPAYSLEVLSFEDSLSLLARHALGAKNFDGHPNLKKVGEGIVRKCGGLPLAVKTLGGLLRAKRYLDDWEKILNDKIWDISEEKSAIIPALRLSYYHLPSHLKHLFAFCAIFPKDYEFYRDELVLLWMAEGFLPLPKQGGKEVEYLDSYFDELLSRSFFQPSTRKEPRFVMHDLINDLAKSVSGDVCVNFNDVLENSLLSPIHGRTRHMSFDRHTCEVWNRFKNLDKLKHLRTLIALPICKSPWAACCYLTKGVLYELLPKLRCLRVLSLSGYYISELPKFISYLKLLRYVNLSHTKIKCLPESVSNLLNLQTLLLQGCSELNKLPQGIGNLINLCHLDISDTINLTEMPRQIGNLTGLQKLSKFIVGKSDCEIRQLKHLKNLGGKLSILGLHNVADVRQAIDAELRNKCKLFELVLQWRHGHENFQNAESEMLVLDSLKPHTNLEKLTISFYGGTRFPSWIGDPSFAKIVHLKLSHCTKCVSLPPLGKLPLLKDLRIQGMDAIQSVGLEFYGDDSHSVENFPSLETLNFEDMLEWKDWLPSSEVNEEAKYSFSCLSELTLRNCPKLVGKLPHCLPSLVKLSILKCPMLGNVHVNLPALHELKLEDCNKIALRSMPDVTCPITSFEEQFILSVGELKILEISNCTRLAIFCDNVTELEHIFGLELLKIKNCPQFLSFTENDTPVSCSLKKLVSLKCCSVEQLPSDLHQLTSLKYLSIESCPKLMLFPEDGLMSSLKHLVIKDCQALEFLTESLMTRNHRSEKCVLEYLEIEDCPSLRCFRGKIPTTLKGLKIRNCTQLQSLPAGVMHNDSDTTSMSHLEHLEIIGCSSLTSFPAGKLPSCLITLKICDCCQLEPLSDMMLYNNTSLEFIEIFNYTALAMLPQSLHSLMHLTQLIINNCLSLKSFPEVDPLLPNLRTLNINDCSNLETLPTRMQNLTSLQELSICGCPELVCLPEGDLPPNLIILEIWDCANLKGPMSEWNLHYLTSLKEFSIAGGCFSDVFSFPEEQCLLPATLNFIWIGRLQNLASLSVQLRSLISLEVLEIVQCPNLKSLPKEGLPPTLGRFSIRDCPLLAKQCFQEKGVYRHMINRIPCFEIDGEVI